MQTLRNTRQAKSGGRPKKETYGFEKEKTNGFEKTQKKNNPMKMNNENENVNENDIKKINKKNAEPKKHFADFVTMTNAEYEKLVSTYGKDFANQCVTVLDNYKGSNGKTYKSDYRAILSWVVDKVKSMPKSSYEQRNYGNLDFLYANKGGNK